MPWSLSQIAAALRVAWSMETCAPEDRLDWSPDNPARGQCGTTALVGRDFLGGELVQGEVQVDGRRSDGHWWNALPDGCQVDLTREQFAPHEVVVGGEVVAIPDGFDGGRLAGEYAVLQRRVARELARGATVRARRDEDLPDLVVLLRRVHETSQYPNRWPDDPAAWLQSRDEAAWLAEVSGVVVGQVALRTRADAVYVNRLFVDARLVGAGVGTVLLDVAVGLPEPQACR